MSPRFKLSREQGVKILEVAVWAFGSATVAGMIALTQWEEAPGWLIALGPALNVFAYGAKEWFQTNKPE